LLTCRDGPTDPRGPVMAPRLTAAALAAGFFKRLTEPRSSLDQRSGACLLQATACHQISEVYWQEAKLLDEAAYSRLSGPVVAGDEMTRLPSWNFGPFS